MYVTRYNPARDLQEFRRGFGTLNSFLGRSGFVFGVLLVLLTLSPQPMKNKIKI